MYLRHLSGKWIFCTNPMEDFTFFTEKPKITIIAFSFKFTVCPVVTFTMQALHRGARVVSVWKVYENMDHWTRGVLDTWSIGHVEYWTRGVLDTWSIGHVEYWTRGPLNCITNTSVTSFKKMHILPSLLKKMKKKMFIDLNF